MDGSQAPRESTLDRAVFLELLLDATQDGIVDWDLVHGVETHNPRWMNLFGFDDESLADRPKHWRELVHPDDEGMAEQLILDHLKDEWPFVAVLRMRHHHHGYRTILLRGAAQRDAARRPLRMVIIFQDVSAQVELEERHVALAAALPDTLFRVANDGLVLELKAGEDHDGSPFRALRAGRPLRECLPADVVDRLEGLLARAADGDVSARLELRTPCGPAAAVHHELRVVKAGANAWVGIVRDVTDQHVLADRLLQSEKLGAIGQLAAGVAHEINTPMQYIGDNLHFAQTAVDDLLNHARRLKALLTRNEPRPSVVELALELEASEQAADLAYVDRELPRAIERSLEGLGRVTTIVRALKAFAHPSGREMAPVDIGDLIESTVAVATNEWKFVASVEVSVDPDLPHVICAGGEIGQVLLNLLVNAAHAIGDRVGTSGDKGRIAVHARRDGDDCELLVRDTGTGIPEAVRSRVFDPFFTTKEVGKGTGQGLALSHTSIVQHHGGSIRFETEMGAGTTFLVRIPLDGRGEGDATPGVATQDTDGQADSSSTTAANSR
jgi:PAS domain S-box-containing protein